MAIDNNEFVSRLECQQLHGGLKDILESLNDEQHKLNDRLYRDNGNRSIQTILNNHDKIIKIILWIVGAISVGILGTFGSFLVFFIKKVIIFKG